jgi:hypothetical protein
MVRRFEGDEYGILLRPGSKGPFSIEEKLTFNLGMTVREAKDAKPNLGVALLCTLVRAEVLEGYRNRVSGEFEWRGKRKFIVVEPNDLWIFDRPDGGIWMKHSD